MKKIFALLLLAVPGCYLPQPQPAQPPQIIERREEYREYRERDNDCDHDHTIVAPPQPQRNIIISPNFIPYPYYPTPRPYYPPHCPPPHHPHYKAPVCPPQHAQPKPNHPIGPKTPGHHNGGHHK